MSRFNHLFIAFLKDKNTKNLMANLRNLEPSELNEINSLIDYKNETLLPLSILIRLADSIDLSQELIQKFIIFGAKIDFDYGYHGGRHPNKPLPPLIEAIQFSLSRRESFNLYTQISKSLIENGASVNKIRNNISPLFACYNFSKNIDEEHPEENEEIINSFNSRKRNKIIFDVLLNSSAIELEEYDIVKDVFIPWRSEVKTFGGQLLDLMDRELKHFPNEKIKNDFFVPLFNKMIQKRKRDNKALKRIYQNNLTQDKIDHGMKNGLIFSYVARFYRSDIFSLAARIVSNTSEQIDYLANDIKKNGVAEIKCLSGMHGLPTKYFGSNNKVYLEGVCYHAENIRPLLFSKSDIWSYPRVVTLGNQTLKTFSFEDHYFKVANFTFSGMIKNREIANERRIGNIKENISREPINVQSLKLKKAHYSILFHPDPLSKKYSYIPDRIMKGLPHNECLSNIGMPSAILSVLKVHDTVESEFSSKDHDWIDSIYESFIALRDIQRQRHFYYLTGELIPIVHTTSKDNYPHIVSLNEMKSIHNLFQTLNRHQVNKEDFMKLLVENKFFHYSNDIFHDIQNFYSQYDITHVKHQELLLLWSVNMGLNETTRTLLEKGVTINIKLANDLGLLDDVIKKGHVEQANFLLKKGLIPKNLTEFHHAIEKYGDRFFYLRPSFIPIEKISTISKHSSCL